MSSSPVSTPRAIASAERHGWLAPDRLAYAAIAAYALYAAYLGKLLSIDIDPHRFRDFGILMEFARRVAETGRYPAIGVYYPPPCMIVFDVLRRLGPEATFRLHLIAQGFALCFVVVAWQRRIAAPRAGERAAAAIIAVLGAFFYVNTELRMHNVNLVSLALVTAAVLSWRRAVPSALLLGANLAIKPYGAALLLPWMAWHGAWRWLAASFVAALLFFVALPVAWFGVGTTAALYADWLRELAVVATPEAMRANPLSLQAAVAVLAGADLAAPAVVTATRVLSAAWIAAVAAYFLMVARPRTMPDGERLAAQVGALLIAPLPLGPLQQPGRGAALLVAMLAIASGICDPARPRAARAAMAAIVAIVAIAPRLVPMGPLHAGLTLILCALVLLALAILHASAPRR